jgi:hypothetical protein
LELPGIAGFVYSWIEPEHRIEPAYVKGLENKAGCSRHPHFAAGCGNLVVTGNEAADAGTVNLSDTRNIENDGAVCFAQ